MFTYIYFLRHGDIENPGQVLYGRMPGFGLSDKGKMQIKKAAGFLLDKHIDLIYSSPLLRTRQSAEIVKKKLGLSKVIFSEGLLEVETSLQGKPLICIRRQGDNLFALHKNGTKGETIEQVLARMQKFVLKVINKHQGKHIVVVSHGDPIMIIWAKINALEITNESIHSGNDKYIQKGQIFLAKFNQGRSEIEAIPGF